MSILQRFRPASWLILAAGIAGAAAPVAGALHALGDDAACGEPRFAHHPITQLESIRSSAEPEHCDVCHLQRTLCGASLEPHRIAVRRPPARLRTAALLQLTGRAPPSLLG
jgi:hypothetical protein